MPTARFHNSILSIIIAKFIFAIKYLCLPVACSLLLLTHGYTADTADIGESAESTTQLTLNDCIKCHPGIVALIRGNGMAHRDKITCLDCHVGHPPRNKEVIPACSRCHKGKAHFGLGDCLTCHTNPHTPLQITLTRAITAPCTTCHNGQLEQLQANRSVHSTLDCTACHTKHGYLPPCSNCHAPHLEGMSNDTCKKCHKPHMPLVVTLTADTPAEYCGPCHPKAYALLGRSRAKHRQVLCAECHAGRHKTIPVCQKCHNQPHSQSILDRFDSCGACHGIAHDLKLNKIDIRLENQPR